MAYNLAQREEIVQTNQDYRRKVAGALSKHCRYLFDAQRANLSEAEQRQMLSILASPWPHVEAAGRAVIYYPTQDNLSDITALTDTAVQNLVPSIWPMLVAAWGGTLATP